MFSTKSLTTKIREFEGKHPKARIVAKGFGYIFSERMLKFIVGFFVHAMVARHLGPKHFGKLSYVIKTVNIFYTFALFGVDELIIKHLMENKYGRADILKTVFQLRFVMGLIGLFALGVLLLVFKPEGGMFSLLTFIYGINILLQTFNIFELDFQARLSFKPLFLANNISYITASGLRVLGVVLKMPLTFFLSTYIIGEIILKSLIQRKAGLAAFKGKFNPELAKLISRESFPYFISAFIILLDQRLSFIFIESNLELEELGNYSVAVTLVDLWLFLPTAVCASVFPTIVTAFNGQKEHYKVRIQYLTDIIVWLAISFSICVFFLSDVIIKVLYGSKYDHAPEALRWYAFTTIPLFFNLARVKWIALEKNLKVWLGICAMGLGMNFLGHLWAVPQYGVKGAIGSFIASQVLANLVMAIFFPSVRTSLKILLNTLTFPYRLFTGLK